jgi:hypothetical protein
MKTSHNLNNDIHAQDSLFIHCEAYPLFYYYEAYPLFRHYEAYPLFYYYEAYPLFRHYGAYPLFRYYVHALCFKIHTLHSILLFLANHAFFKYDKPINMQFYYSTLHNLNHNRTSHSNTLNQFNTFHSCIIS